MYLEPALRYAAQGWAVFPLAPGQKVPRKDTKGILEATRDDNRIKQWWRENPRYNIGIACGDPSGLFVVDIDPRHNGDKTFARLQEQHGNVPPTIIVQTGGGGTQLYFEYAAGLRSGASTLGEGVDHRGAGGYVVAPPSLHPSGDRYQFFDGYSPHDVQPAPVPEWIRNLLERPEGVRPQAIEPEFYRDLFARGVKAGGQNDALVKMAGHLIRKKLDPFLVMDILSLWQAHRFDPPGDPKKLEGIVDRVAGKEMERINRGRGRG